jgi:predicted CXXCH cytochrome family protein
MTVRSVAGSFVAGVALLVSAVGLPAAPLAAARCTGAKLAAKLTAGDSKACLACHDGIVASAVFPEGAGLRGLGRMGNHPIYVSYTQAYLRKPEEYVAPSLLNPKVKLVDGQIECTTCHALNSREPAMLVVSDYRSALCLSCHRK